MIYEGYFGIFYSPSVLAPLQMYQDMYNIYTWQCRELFPSCIWCILSYVSTCPRIAWSCKHAHQRKPSRMSLSTSTVSELILNFSCFKRATCFLLFLNLYELFIFESNRNPSIQHLSIWYLFSLQCPNPYSLITLFASGILSDNLWCPFARDCSAPRFTGKYCIWYIHTHFFIRASFVRTLRLRIEFLTATLIIILPGVPYVSF